MSLENPDIDSNLAYIEVAANNEEIFNNSKIYDVLFYSTSNQNILIGPYNNKGPSVLELNSKKITINGRLFTTLSIDTNTINADLVDVNDVKFQNAFGEIANIQDIVASNLTLDKGQAAQLKVNDIYCKNNYSSNIFVDTVTSSNIINNKLYSKDVQIEKLKGANIDIDNAKINTLSNVETLYNTNMYSNKIQASNIMGRDNTFENVVANQAKIDSLNVTGFLTFST